MSKTGVANAPNNVQKQAVVGEGNAFLRRVLPVLCVFERGGPQHKYLIFTLRCVEICLSASHATINSRMVVVGVGVQRSLNSSSVLEDIRR